MAIKWIKDTYANIAVVIFGDFNIDIAKPELIQNNLYLQKLINDY